MEFTNQTLVFSAEGLADNTLLVAKLRGVERLSDLFRFELELVSTQPDLDMDALIHTSVKLGIKQRIDFGGGESGGRMRWFQGVLSEFEQLGKGEDWIEYRAVLVPRVWQLGLFQRSRIFLGKSAPQIVKSVLEGLGLGHGAGQDFQIFPAGDDDPGLRAASAGELSGPTADQDAYPKRDYVVQYEETDLAFVERWLEHEGIFYWFDNDHGQEQLLFGDGQGAFKPVDRKTFPYRPASAHENSETRREEEVVSFACRREPLPQQVTLNDYNWRTPTVRLSNTAEVDKDGVGLQMEYNDHYKTAEQGKALAKVRAQERACRARVFRGTSTCRGFRPGKTFSLGEHFRGDFNRDYLLIEVEHAADQAINLRESTVTGANYQNAFRAIPADVPFRPARRTDWPAIKGVMHAKIDANADSPFAQLDADGCYAVRVPFDPAFADTEKVKPLEASRRVRMAQPYAGQDSGFHFPLRGGTEVLLTHLDGDPDRPLIAGAVPNPETGALSHGVEPRNRILTGSGNRFEMHDQGSSPGFLMADGFASMVSDQRFHFGGGSSGGGSPAPGTGGVRRPRQVTALRKPTPGPADASGQPADASAQHAATGALPDAGLPGPGQGSQSQSMGYGGSDSSYDPNLGSGMNVDLLLDSPADAVEYFFTGAQGIDPDDGTKTTDAAVTSAMEYLTSSTDLRYLNKTVRETQPFAVTSKAKLEEVIDALLRRHSTFSGKKDGGIFVDKFHDMTGASGDDSAFAEERWAGDPLTGEAKGSADVDLSDDERNKYLSSTKAQDFLANVRAFIGNAFGSKLSIQVGDQVEVNDGDTYTFGNVTNNVEFGTGGYSYKQEDGDCYAEEYNYGNRAAVNYTYGTTESMEWKFGAEHGSSFTFDAKATFSLTIGASTETSIELSARNNNSIWIGGKLTFDMSVGIEGKMSIAATATWELSVGITRTHTNVEHLTEIKIPQEEEISILGLKAYLTKLQNGLSETQNALALTNNALTKTNSALAHTDNALTDTDNALTDTDNSLTAAKSALSVSDNLLSGTKMALSISETSLSNTTLSGLTTMS